MSKRAGLMALTAGGAVLLMWGALQARSAVVTVRFEPRQPGIVVDYLFLTVGGTKQSTQGLRGGEQDRFSFEPMPDEPLEMGFWIQGVNGGWEGPVLQPRHRIEVTFNEGGQVTWKQCLWPCW